MKGFVFWVGWIYIAGGILLFFPRLLNAFYVRTPASVFWTEALGLLSMFLGIALVLGARDLSARGAIVYWAGWTLAVLGVTEFTFSFTQALGLGLAASGAFDLAVGLVLVAALPRHLGRGHADLAQDRS